MCSRSTMTGIITMSSSFSVLPPIISVRDISTGVVSDRVRLWLFAPVDSHGFVEDGSGDVFVLQGADPAGFFLLCLRV